MDCTGQNVDGADSPQMYHSLYFWELATFQVEGTFFRVPKYGFLSSNETFFSNLQATLTEVEHVQTEVFLLNGITKESFETLLSVMYPRLSTEKTFDQWVSALDLSTKWQLSDIREKVIATLGNLPNFKSKDPAEIAVLAKNYGVFRWLHDAYASILQRTDLSIDMLRNHSIDWPTISRLFEARARITSSGADKTNPSANCRVCKHQHDRSARKPGYTPFYKCTLSHPTVDTYASEIIENESKERSDIIPERPPAGHRLALVEEEFPDVSQLGVVPCTEGNRPIFIGSAIKGQSVIPCKVIPWLRPGARVLIVSDSSIEGLEAWHHGRFDLLLYSMQHMEWVPTSNGEIPPGRVPIEGGYEVGGAPLYHALAVVDDLEVPGRTGKYLGGSLVGLYGEHKVTENYSILCWRLPTDQVPEEK